MRGLNVYATGDRELEPLIPDPPLYRREAVRQGLTDGFVDVEFIVTRTGSTRDVRVVGSSARVFESSAIEAAESLRYKPGLRNGKPVETPVRRRIEFRIEEADWSTLYKGLVWRPAMPERQSEVWGVHQAEVVAIEWGPNKTVD